MPEKREGSDVDYWQLIRDSVCYAIGIALFTLFVGLDIVEWWSGILMMIYYYAYTIVLSKNESIRDSILLLVGLKHEDDSFNADEQTRQKKRRTSITELAYKNLIDRED